MLDLGHEQRRVRFASIIGIEREDLPLAGEVWHADLCGQPWCKREYSKFAGIFMQYIADPSEKLVSVNYIERTLQMDVAEMREALRQMKMFGAVDAFTLQDGAVRVSLRLTLTQRLQVLEMRTRFLALSGLASMREVQVAEAAEQWRPSGSDCDPEATPDDERAEAETLRSTRAAAA